MNGEAVLAARKIVLAAEDRHFYEHDARRRPLRPAAIIGIFSHEPGMPRDRFRQ
jgi:hypothetical protein